MEYCEGKNLPSNLTNYEKKITVPEIEYAFQCGYKIILLDAVVSQRQTYVFREFIDKLYNKRLETKKLMKQLKNEGKEDTQEYVILDAVQLNCKLQMNALYGKFGTSIDKAMNEITTNEDLICEMIKKNQIASVEEIVDEQLNQRFFRFSSLVEQTS